MSGPAQFRRRSLLAWCLAYAVLGLAFVTGCGVLGQRPERGLLPSAHTSSSRPSPRTTPRPPAELLASIRVELGSGPVGLAAVDGSVWVTSFNTHTLSRVDPATNRVVQTVDIGQRSCGLPIDALGDLVTQACLDGTSSVVVDGHSGAIKGKIPDAGGAAVAAGGSIWINNYQSTVMRRIDPKTLKVQKTIRVATAAPVAFDGAFVWAAACDTHARCNGDLAKIDPANNRVVGRYRLPPMDSPYMTYGFGALWIKEINTPNLYRLDLSTGRTTSAVLAGWQRLSKFGDQPVAVGAGSLWVRVADGSLARIDPSTSAVVGRYPADAFGGGGHPLVAFGSLWVTNIASHTVWRLQIRPTG